MAPKPRPRMAWPAVEIEASWRSIASALFVVAGLLWLAYWWVR